MRWKNIQWQSKGQAKKRKIAWSDADRVARHVPHGPGTCSSRRAVCSRSTELWRVSKERLPPSAQRDYIQQLLAANPGAIRRWLVLPRS